MNNGTPKKIAHRGILERLNLFKNGFVKTVPLINLWPKLSSKLSNHDVFKEKNPHKTIIFVVEDVKKTKRLKCYFCHGR
ncbi:hypothetical protein [Dryocola boscaweniae]|uniref:Uncharacterized protein n=1 Tax=Dryocola boscaweniae TaxID=2925397 RepID=A0A9X3AAR0_9ENTR|nr:hypothetical protein [Dryocola boscaweniae]MCT4701734.1 hypothetical protein [Dryocola boscaweniae]